MTLQDLKILIVDDSDIVLEMLTYLFVEFGAIVETAENGEFAVSKVKSTDFDIVLMDIQMPVMDGITATEKIRLFNTNLPIIAVTAASEQEGKSFIELGFNDYVQKPVNINFLNQRISQNLRTA